jgi:outer membrane immunogenic protein
MYLPYNWTGAYAGFNAGWGWTSGSADTVLNGVAGTVSGSGNGGLAGVQVGYNFQTGSIVYGIEADFQLGFGRGSFTGTNGAFTTTGTARAPWFGTVRGRLGYAMDRWMVYGTGGAVYGSTRIEGTIAPTGVGFNDTESYWTWTAGAGVETAIGSGWTAKLEYLYIGTPNNGPAPPGTSSVSGTSRSHVLRLGVNTRF